ncbi:hypothetical protein D3C72_2008190 [compost metagenome]
MAGDFRMAPMHFRGTLTDTTRFSKQPQPLPTERLKPITAHDKLSDNIALRMKRDLQQRLLLREHEAAGFVGNGDHESGGFGALRGNLWQCSASLEPLTGIESAAVAQGPLKLCA